MLVEHRAGGRLWWRGCRGTGAGPAMSVRSFSSPAVAQHLAAARPTTRHKRTDTSWPAGVPGAGLGRSRAPYSAEWSVIELGKAGLGWRSSVAQPKMQKLVSWTVTCL
jgi:hypothetical protein